MSFVYTRDGRVKVFVDGCYVPGSSKGGIGVWFRESHDLNCALQVDTRNKDSNDIELMAAQRAIDIFEKDNLMGRLLIYTDSQHVIHHKDSLKTSRSHVVQRVDEQHHAEIREADKLARRGAGKE